MAWRIRKELKKHLKDIGFNVTSWGNDCYEIKIKHASSTISTIEDAKRALGIRDMVYKEMANFEIENGIVLTITI